GVTARDRLKTVVEVEDDLVQRELGGEHDSCLGDVLKVSLAAAFVFDEFEDASYVFFVGENLCSDDRLFDLLDLGGIGPAGGVVDFDDGAVGEGDVIAHAGRGNDEVEIIFALEALLDDFQMEQAKEAAAEAKAKGDGGFRLEGERCVVEAKFLESVTEHGVRV